MKSLFVEQLERNGEVREQDFALASISVRSGQRKQYLALVLADKTGEVDGRMWDGFEEIASSCKAGCYVRVTGRTEEYGGKLQLVLERIETLPAASVERKHFVPHTEHDVREMDAEVRGVVAGFANPYLRSLLQRILDDPRNARKFSEAPAAVKNHHAFLGGLLEHTRDLLRAARAILPMYPEVNPDLLYAGIILHDFGKLVELNWDAGAFSYTLPGEMLGHISLMAGQLRNYIAAVDEEGARRAEAAGEAYAKFPRELWLLLEHMLLSHHGRMEYGSPKLPMTPEALLLSALDDLEAKFAKVRSEFKKPRKPGELTERIYSMDNRRLLDSEKYLRAAGIWHRDDPRQMKLLDPPASEQAAEVLELVLPERDESLVSQEMRRD